MCYHIIIRAVVIGHSVLMFAFTSWGVCLGGVNITDEAVKAINLIFAWQILELGPCPLTPYLKLAFYFNRNI